MSEVKTYKLFTPEGEKVKDNEATLLAHPNPQFMREAYLSLNGMWDYRISKEIDIHDPHYDGKIRVPYPVESELSQVAKRLEKNDYLIYHKSLDLKGLKIIDKVLLNFIMIDQIAWVYLNDKLVAKCANPYLPICLDITPYLEKKNNELIVVVKDTLDKTIPYGKQSQKPGGIYYTPCSGIMQGAYLESTVNDYIESFKVTTLNDGYVTFDVITKAKEIKYEIISSGKVIQKGKTDKKSFTIKIDNPILWDIDNPYLYDLKINDVKSYFAFRKVSIKNKKIELNNKPILIKGVLDQGYYPDGIYVVADYKCYENDILAMKDLGFNTLRKHIKVESPYYYYLCDKMGMLVMQDCINNGEISFIKDTLLPTLRFQKKKDIKLNNNVDARKNFIATMIGEVNYLYNHPSIIYWTIFNEGWGQFCADGAYETLKEIDSTRIVDATSGWFWQNSSDVDSYHIYLRKLKVDASTRPIMISEFGAYIYSVEGHVYCDGNRTAYHAYKTASEFKQAYNDLFETQVKPLEDIISGYVYTQVSDVEEENNGLLTYDRKVNKIKDL